VRLVAAVAGNNRNVISVPDFQWPGGVVLLVGNEYHGLEAQWLEVCDHLVTIPLAPGCDSLNVAVATGVLLHEMTNPRSF
jgi:tRNA G18 (ribose-2'-O)-methylase SpoU